MLKGSERRVARVVVALIATLAFAALTGCGESDADKQKQAANDVDRAFAYVAREQIGSAARLGKHIQKTLRDNQFVTIVNGMLTSETAYLSQINPVATNIGRPESTHHALAALGLTAAQADLAGTGKAVRSNERSVLIEAVRAHLEGALAAAEVEISRGGVAKLKFIAEQIRDQRQAELKAMNSIG